MHLAVRRSVAGDGNYSLTVKATDSAGNTHPSPAQAVVHGRHTASGRAPSSPSYSDQPGRPVGDVRLDRVGDPTATFHVHAGLLVPSLVREPG